MTPLTVDLATLPMLRLLRSLCKGAAAMLAELPLWPCASILRMQKQF